MNGTPETNLEKNMPYGPFVIPPEYLEGNASGSWASNGRKGVSFLKRAGKFAKKAAHFMDKAVTVATKVVKIALAVIEVVEATVQSEFGDARAAA